MSRLLSLLLLALVLLPVPLRADEIDKKYPLDDQLRVLADDVKSENYRKLVLEKMLVTDLAAEWQRVATLDNPESFLEKHGGKEKVFADPGLKRAYERRVQIRNDFLELMRQGFKRYKQVAPFDRGEKPEPAGTLTRKVGAAALVLAPVPPTPDAERHWPRLRGPSGQGETTAKGIPVKWNKEGENILWRVKVPGQGNSSPVIWGDRLFLTSAEDKGTKRLLHCYHTADGRLLWTKQAPEAKPESIGFKNTYASSTPVTDGERVIVVFGSSGMVCYDFEGKQLWHRDLNIRTTHGPGASPILYKDLVIFAQDQNQAPSIFLAVDRRTGRTVWEGKRERAMSWMTPAVVRVGDHDELIVAGGETIRGYDPMTGKELWLLRGPTREVVPMIVVGRDMIYCASGRNGPTLGLRPGGQGDVTETHLVWRTVRGGPHVPSPVLANGRLYTANDTGIVTCLDAATGKLIFQDRIRDTFASSPIVVGDRIYVGGESGNTYVLKASDRFELMAKNDLGSPIQASPAAVANRLYLRTQEELVCIGAR